MKKRVTNKNKMLTVWANEHEFIHVEFKKNEIWDIEEDGWRVVMRRNGVEIVFNRKVYERFFVDKE